MFFTKNARNKYVRQIPNNSGIHVIEKQENNKTNKNEENMDERLSKVESVINEKTPKKNIKVEKKEKGLIERTENSTIVLNEDNKMLLND